MTLPPDDSRAGSQPPSGPVDETQSSSMPPILPTPNPRGEVQDSPGWTSEPARDPRPPAPHTSDAPATPTQPNLTTILGNLRRNGRWQVPSKLTLWLGMADAILDFGEAECTSKVVELHIHGLMSSAKIIVPPDVDVALTGGSEFMSEVKSDVPSHAVPRYQIRVTTHSFMSSFKAQVLAVGEQPKKWWKH